MKTIKRSSIEKIYRDTFIDDNRVTVLYEGDETFHAIFDGIRNARQTIFLIFYIFRDDETGKELVSLLKNKAKEGLKVCVLYDHFGSLMTPRRFWGEMRLAGVKVRASRPFKWQAPRDYIHRDHRKLVVLDGEIAFTGGLNIANEYRGYTRFRKKQKGWRDTAVKLEGPAALKLYEIFRKTWQFWKGEPIGKLSPESAKVYSEGPSVMPIFSSSSRGRKRMRKLLHWCIRNSGDKIDLTTAYFTPSRRMLYILREAVRRGVRVRLLLPGKSDILPAQYAGMAFFKQLLQAGVEIYLYQETILHAKTYVFDNIFSIVGSANLDFQSLRKNDEGNVGVYDEGFAQKIVSLFERDLEKSVKVELVEWLKRPFCDKIKEKFFALFRRRL